MVGTVGGDPGRERDRGQDVLFAMAKALARHSGVYGAFDAVGRLGSFLLIPLYTRALETTGYGTLEIFVVSQALLLVLAVAGLNSALVRYTAGEEGPERRTVFHTALAAVLLLAGAVAGVLFLAAPALDRLVFPGESHVLEWRLLAGILFVEAAAVMCLALLRARERPARYSAIVLTRLGVTLGACILLVGGLDRGVPGVLLGNLLGSLAGLAVGLVLVRGDLGIGWNAERARRLAAFGFPLIGGGLAFFLVNSADRFFLKALTTSAELGVYSLGYKFGLVASILVNAFVAAWPPLLIRIDREPDAHRIVGRIQTYFLVATGFLVLGVSVSASDVIRMVAGPEYANAARFVPPVLVGYLFYGVTYIQSAGSILRGRTVYMSIVMAVGAGVNLAGNALLIPLAGGLGAAWATFAAFACMALCMTAIARGLYPVPFERRLAVGLLAVGLLAVLSLVLGSGEPGWTRLALRAGVVAVGFPVFLYAVFLDGEERLRVRRLLGRRSA